MKRRIAALALSAVMVLGTVAVAAGTEKTITVTPMTLNVNGEVVAPNGGEAFAYNGATYVPLRSLNELRGGKVEWDPADPTTARITGLTYADTIAWDGAYDVVVIGMGFAGSSAAIEAADNGASVLITEKAPEGEAGGNSRVCHQLFATVDTAEGGFEYYSNMRGKFDSTSDEMLMTFMEGMTHLRDYVASLGTSKETMTGWKGKGIGTYDCEHPEIPGGLEHFFTYTITDQVADGALYRLVKQNIVDRGEKIDVWYESPAVHLIQDPQSKTIVGVQIDRGGKTLNIRATNGVVMACGGFENNPEMLETYLRLGGQTTFFGSAYNTGDGIRMAQEVGAEMWHMNNYVSGGVGGSMMPATNAAFAALAGTPGVGATILVGPDGTRFINEEAIKNARHGYVYVAGSYILPRFPEHVYGIFDQSKVDAYQMGQLVDSEVGNGYLHKADTLKELGEKLGMEHLADTAAVYDRYCKNGKDEQFRRDSENMIAFGKGPFYAYEFTVNCVLNTQGGAKRNEKAEVIGLNGEPIPHLYSAGEFGGLTARTYQGGTNVAECLVFGPIAGRNAAAAKEPLPPYTVTAAQSNLVYTPGHESDLTGGKTYDFETADNQYLGVSPNGMGGDIVVRVTLDGKTITDVEILEHNETPGVGTPAVEKLPGAIKAAGSTQVDNISGCTVSCKAIKQAVEDALAQVK